MSEPRFRVEDDKISPVEFHVYETGFDYEAMRIYDYDRTRVPSVMRKLNSHDALLAACEAALENLDGWEWDDVEVMCQLRAAVSAARSESWGI